MGPTVARARAPTAELSRAEQERQEVVIIEAPDSMGSSRLEPIRRLQDAHDRDVSPHHADDKGYMIRLLDHAKVF
jgi:hypothetical protein